MKWFALIYDQSCEQNSAKKELPSFYVNISYASYYYIITYTIYYYIT